MSSLILATIGFALRMVQSHHSSAEQDFSFIESMIIWGRTLRAVWKLGHSRENSNLPMTERFVTSQSSSSDVSSPPPPPAPPPPPSTLDRLDLDPSEVSSRKESMASASETDFSFSLFPLPTNPSLSLAESSIRWLRIRRRDRLKGGSYRLREFRLPTSVYRFNPLQLNI